jgi:hypothetical protein
MTFVRRRIIKLVSFILWQRSKQLGQNIFHSKTYRIIMHIYFICKLFYYKHKMSLKK